MKKPVTMQFEDETIDKLNDFVASNKNKKQKSKQVIVELAVNVYLDKENAKK